MGIGFFGISFRQETSCFGVGRWLLGFSLLCCCGCWDGWAKRYSEGWEGFRRQPGRGICADNAYNKATKYDGTYVGHTCGEVRGALAYMGTLISWDLTLARPRSW